MKKKIVIDATPFLFPFTGIGRVTKTLCETLFAMDSQYEFALYSRKFSPPNQSAMDKTKRLYHFQLPKLTEPMMALTGLIEFATKADLFHATDHYMPLKKPQNAIVTIHDTIFLAEASRDWKGHKLQAKTVPNFAKKCKDIITCSEYSKKDIIKYLDICEEKITVVPWGIDDDFFNIKYDNSQDNQFIKNIVGEDGYFLAINCSVGRKNTLRLLDAYNLLLADNPKNHLVLAWNPPEEIKEKYQNAKQKQRIHFIGKVTENQLRDLYRNATALVYPSLHEGFGLPILEAMSCGSPVITSNTTSIPEVGGDAAIYIDPLETASIKQAMTDFENNASIIHGLREKGLQQAKKFSWQKCAEKTLAVYEKHLH